MTAIVLNMCVIRRVPGDGAGRFTLKDGSLTRRRAPRRPAINYRRHPYNYTANNCYACRFARVFDGKRTRSPGHRRNNNKTVKKTILRINNK